MVLFRERFIMTGMAALNLGMGVGANFDASMLARLVRLARRLGELAPEGSDYRTNGYYPNSLSPYARNFGNVFVEMQTIYPNVFNPFATIAHANNAESLVGVGIPNGNWDGLYALPRFVYNTSASNVLSTGNVIKPMTGGNFYGLSEIDGKPWLGMLVYPGNEFSGFFGILLIMFTGYIVNNANELTSRPISTVKDIFYPAIPNGSYHQIYAVAIDRYGNIERSDVSGLMGWQHSDTQNATDKGYNTINKFSFDDGCFGFIFGQKTQGNAPGLDYRVAGQPSYGMGNYNGSDNTSLLFWNGYRFNTGGESQRYIAALFSGDHYLNATAE